jgi:hypothetical protein
MEPPVGKDSSSHRSTKPPPSGKRHPLFGALKDWTFVPPGVDLTEPADPNWGKVCENDAPNEAP